MKTLEPLLRALGDAPASEQLLALKICDPAIGSGAFLVETCRFLGDQPVAAWSREGTLESAA
jgi:type I restriction-modification system DNA methylase subunit